MIHVDVVMFDVEPSRAVVRVGHYCSAEVAGYKAIMTTIPELSGCHAYGMRGVLFQSRCTTISPSSAY
jgi:hypothetical protein